MSIWTISFGFFFQWHIDLYGLFNAKASLVEEQQSYSEATDQTLGNYAMGTYLWSNWI